MCLLPASTELWGGGGPSSGAGVRFVYTCSPGGVCSAHPCPSPVFLAFLRIRRDNPPSPTSGPSLRLPSPRLHCGFHHYFTFRGGWGELPVCFSVLPPLRSPSPGKPPPFRHRNSPSCELKVPEFKIATGYYLYSSRKMFFGVCSHLFCHGSDGLGWKQPVLGLYKHFSRGEWVVRGAFRCWEAGTRPAQKRLVSPPWSRTVWPGKPNKVVHGLGEVSS